MPLPDYLNQLNQGPVTSATKPRRESRESRRAKAKKDDETMTVEEHQAWVRKTTRDVIFAVVVLGLGLTAAIGVSNSFSEGERKADRTVDCLVSDIPDYLCN
jgi:hypothetical protein